LERKNWARVEFAWTIALNDHVHEAVPKLVQRLQDAGIKLDLEPIGLATGKDHVSSGATEAAR
jgi:hypothetical protein